MVFHRISDITIALQVGFKNAWKNGRPPSTSSPVGEKHGCKTGLEGNCGERWLQPAPCSLPHAGSKGSAGRVPGSA